MKQILTILLSLMGSIAFAQKSTSDWANLSKYQKANSLLALTQTGEERIVFLGSSIIEFWRELDSAYFDENNYIDRGISGQLSPQLLIRFRADVINLKPDAVIILAGSNDLAQDTTATSYQRIMDNIQSMVELAVYNDIKVFLCTYVPIADYPWRRGLHPAQKIVTLNRMISRYGNKAGITILDYFTPLANPENGQKAQLTRDGVHPNLQGYKKLEQATEKALDQWRKQRNP